MKRNLLTRRRVIYSTLFGLPAAAVADCVWLEPDWLRIRKFKIGKGPATHRFVHFTDVHHKGDRAYLETVVKNINHLSPDFVCFTGDLVEEEHYVTETLSILKKIKAPLYGVPGNHDYWCGADFNEIADAFAETGGAWLLDNSLTTKDGKVTLHGAAEMIPKNIRSNPGTKNIMLLHYPESADQLSVKFDLVLAGHTHGGQVRLPFYGALVLPFGTGNYDLGFFNTSGGPLYVSSGIGWFTFNLRFLCRPEIVLFEV